MFWILDFRNKVVSISAFQPTSTSVRGDIKHERKSKERIPRRRRRPRRSNDSRKVRTWFRFEEEAAENDLQSGPCSSTLPNSRISLVLHSPETSLRRSLFSRNWHSGSLKETFHIKCRSRFDSFSHLSDKFFLIVTSYISREKKNDLLVLVVNPINQRESPLYWILQKRYYLFWNNWW